MRAGHSDDIVPFFVDNSVGGYGSNLMEWGLDFDEIFSCQDMKWHNVLFGRTTHKQLGLWILVPLV